MAQFKYIGLQTKADGKIDVRVPKSDGSFQMFTNITPNLTVIDTTDDLSIKALEYAVDLSGMFTYERTA
jgi:hypothetical protein